MSNSVTPTTGVKAIETRYAGCHFRSRLEARWAVFFDHLGIQWQYEPQGFDLPSGRYLPDFWLPESEVWIEVKGRNPTAEDVLKLGGLAAAVSRDRHRCRMLGPMPRRPISLGDVMGATADNDSAVLDVGDTRHQAHTSTTVDDNPIGIGCMIPQPDYVMMTLTAEDEIAGVKAPYVDDSGILQIDMASNYGIPAECWHLVKSIWVSGFPIAQVQSAINAARSARFEHGQSGAA